MSQRLDAWIASHRWKVFGGLAVLGLILAWLCRIIQDDNFISFVCARNLVAGEGLTWFGTYVEGYASFLWVL